MLAFAKMVDSRESYFIIYDLFKLNHIEYVKIYT